MGHWWESDEFVEQVAARVGGNPDRARIRASAREAAQRVELLAGRTFGRTETKTETIDSGGLPFIDVDDLQIGTQSARLPVWPVRDLADPDLSTVLQLRELASLVPTAASDGEALLIAGSFIADVHRAGRLSRDFVLHQLRPLFGSRVTAEQRLAYFRRLADPTTRVQIPIAAAYAQGWWMQMARRLIVVTQNTLEDQRLVEPLLEKNPWLVAAEPTLILARMTIHPVERAFAIRVWPTAMTHRGQVPWRIVARAIHRHGIPIVTVDDASTREEMSCQLLLLAYWHGYLTRDDPALVEAIASAYPQLVHRIRVATDAPDDRSAAALLLEGLLHPGFDPMLGAHSVRKYVSSKARIAVLEHRKAERGGAHAWEQLGVSERYYYKLLARFARRKAGRWQVDDDLRSRMESYLRTREQQRELHRAAMDVLQQRGFTYAAARKWLQRHAIEDARLARPRPSRHQQRAGAPDRQLA